MTRSVRQSAAMDACKSTSPKAMMSMGDLGCSSGLNNTLVATDAIEGLVLLHKEIHQEQLPDHILLHDLPGEGFQWPQQLTLRLPKEWALFNLSGS